MASISGYAIQWGQPAIIAGAFEERFARGSLDRHLAEGHDIACVWHHDLSRPLGRTGNGTLTLRSDNIGLWYSVELAEGSPLAAEAAAMVGNRTVTQMSPGFYVRKEEWDDTGDIPKRLITQAALLEISICIYGAYGEATSAELSDRTIPTNAATRAAAAMRKRGIHS